MPLPNKDTIGNDPKLVKRKLKTRWDCSSTIIVFLAISFLVSIFVSLLPPTNTTTTTTPVNTESTSNTAKNLHKFVRTKEERNNDPPPPVGKSFLELKPLIHEPILLKALMKSCLPQTNNKCKTFIPPNTGGKQRVALLAPPGDLTHIFLQMIEEVIEHAKKQNPATVNIELLPTSHMAPYGYGKTHGLTRIIRVVPQPFILGATDTLQASLHQGEHVGDITLQDLKAALRQQIRYHCRLSHISAHTSLWTITSNDLVAMPRTELLTQIQSFLGLPTITLPQNKNGDDLLEKDMMKVHFQTISSTGSSLLTMNHKHQWTDNNLYQELDQVLLDDLKQSKNLTAWPCESFWTVGEKHNQLELSPITKRISAAMSPNCSAPFTSCFVKRDKCEAKGDGMCS